MEKDNTGAIALYEKHGYAVTDTTEESWKQESEDGNIEMYHADCFVMSKDL